MLSVPHTAAHRGELAAGTMLCFTAEKTGRYAFSFLTVSHMPPPTEASKANAVYALTLVKLLTSPSVLKEQTLGKFHPVVSRSPIKACLLYTYDADDE